MFRLSEIISKPVLSIYEGVRVGFVKNAYFDEKFKKIKGFLLFNDESESGEMFVSSKNIFVIGADSVLVKNLNMLTNILPLENSPVNTNAYSFSGDYAGKISDVIFDEKMNILNLLTNKNKEIPLCEICKIGIDTLFFNASEYKVCVARLKPKITSFSRSDVENIKVNILEIGGAKSGVQKDLEIKNAIPLRVSSNGDFLLGRKASKSILGLNNEYIVKKGQTISEKIIHNAKQHNKLSELTHNVNN